MADIGNLHFGVHLKDYTDAEADKIKKKLESLSVKLNIDASSTKVSNTDTIKKQIEDAVKSISIGAVKVDANAVKAQIEAATQNTTPKVSVTLLKGGLSKDIQDYLDTKSFKVKVTITQSSLNSAIKNLGVVSVPVGVKISSNAIISELKKSLSGVSIPIGISAKSGAALIKDIRGKLKDKKVGIDITTNKNNLRKSVTDALKGKTFHADLKLTVRSSTVQEAIQQAFSQAGLRYNTSASDLRAAKVAEIQQRMAMRAAKANNTLGRSYQRASRDADQFARASVTLSNGLHTNIRLGGQLGTLLGNFASVFGIKDLLRDVVAIGGQLETQRIALSSILQDGGKATTMFSKIQSLAVKSPFGIMDLNQYVKQLSAYQVPYNELYETMKRLADISAGVGVDMGRIILAFGQVKAAGFLKGTELRQFTEANIPMVKALADRFTELRGEIVSAAEVYDMISKKQITFEDVKSVLWDLTSEGGIFYNMQEVLSESLASKWKNLADAVDVMFGKIADGGIGSMLKGIAEGLTELTKNWEYVATAISTATTYFLIHKAAVVAGTKVMASAKGTYAYLLSSKQEEAAALRQEAVYRKLTKAERNLVETSNQLTRADIKKAVTTGQLNKQEALRLITLGKLDKSMLVGSQRMLQISNAEIKAAQNASVLNIAWLNLRIGAKALWTSIKGLASSMWPLLAITGIAEVFTYFSNKSQESSQRIKDSLQVATEGFRNLSDAVKETEGTPNTDAGLISGIDKMTTSLKDYAANSGEILSEIYKKDDSGDYVYDLEKRYELLKEKLLQTKDAYELLSTSMEGFTESANDATDGVFDENLIVNLQDLSESSSEYNKHLNAMTRNAISYKGAMEAAAKADTDFANAIQGKDFREQIKLLRDYKDAAKAFREYLYGNEHATVYGRFNQFEASFIKFGKNLEVVEKDIETFANAYKELLKGSGFDLNNLSEKQKIAIGVDLTGFIDKIEGLDEETKKLFYQRVLETEFNINVTAKYNQGVNEERWRQELIKAAGGEKLEVEVEAMIKGASDYESVVEAVRTMYKDANEVVKDLNPVLLKAEVQFEAGKEVDEESVIFWGLDKETQKAVKEWNKAVRQIKAAQNIANDQGFLLTKTKNRGGSKDPVAEMWKDRVAAIEKAVKMYDQWKQVEGKDKAESRVRGRDEFADLFSGKYGFKLDLEKPTAAYEYIQSLLDENKEKQKELIVNLGVKVSDAELADAKDELNNLLDALKRELDKKTSEWNLYKDLLKATGNKGLSMNIAFGGDIGFNTELDWLKSEIQKKLGDAFKFDDVIAMSGDQLKESGLANIEPLVEKYNEATKKLSQESIKNFIDILNASKDFAQRRTDVERKLQKDLEDLRTNSSTMDKDDLKRREDELIKRAGEETSKIDFEEFKQSSDWVKVFDDLDRVSNVTLDNMTQKIEEFAKQAHLSEEVTKQLVEAMAKLRKESIERNPFKELKEALQMIKNLNAGKKAGLTGLGQYQVKQTDGSYVSLTPQELEDRLKEEYSGLGEAGRGVIEKFDAVAKAADMLGSVLSYLGSDVLTDFGSLISSSTGGATQGAITATTLFGQKAGAWGAIAGAALGMLSSVFAMHDKALQREIEASEAREKAISNIASNLEKFLERTMGGIYSIGIDDETRRSFDEILGRYAELLEARDTYAKEGVSSREGYESYMKLRELGNLSEDTINTIKEALSEDSYYDAQLAALKAERDEVNHQMDLEEARKNTSESKMEDYKQTIRELDDQIENFARDMAESLYGIDFKDWANQLAESLVNAWSSGEDAVKAYRDTVDDILRDLGVSMISQKIIEPMLNDTMNQFLEQFAKDNGELTDDSMKILSGMYDGAEYAAQATEAYLEGLKKLGVDVSDKSEDSKDGLSKGIQSVTESTADLLASYLNALRGDVSVKRTLLEKLIADDIPQMSIIAQAQLTQLNNIAANTLRSADAADRIFDLVNRVVDKGNNKLKI